MTTRNINNTNTGLKAFRYNPSLNVIRPTPISPARLDNFVATHKSIFCHANLQLVLETFSHTQQASKYSQSNGAETALTHRCEISKDIWCAAIVALRDEGWCVEKGGCLDHSWAVLERDGMRIEMDYDTWGEGEMVIAAADAAKLRAYLPTTALVRLRLL